MTLAFNLACTEPAVRSVAFGSRRCAGTRLVRILYRSAAMGFWQTTGSVCGPFFVIAQIVAKVRFQQSPTAPIFAGSGLMMIADL